MRMTWGYLRKLLREAMDLSGIDSGAQDLVFDLRNAGFETTWSCQGGPGHEQPWLTVSVKLSQKDNYDIDRLRAVAYEYGKGPWRVTANENEAYVEIFPSSDPHELESIEDRKLQNRRYFPSQMQGFDGINDSYRRNDSERTREYDKGRDYTVGHGIRRVGGTDEHPYYMSQGDVIMDPNELQEENKDAYDQLERWLESQSMAWDDIDVIFLDSGSTYYVYSKDDHDGTLEWTGGAWKALKS